MTDATDAEYGDAGRDDILAAELSLGLLTGDELAQTQRRARIDMQFLALVEDWDAWLTQLTDDIAPVTPPAGLFRKIARAAYPESPKRIWQSLGILPALLGAGAAALVLIVALNYGGLLQTGPVMPSYTVRMAAEDDSLIVAASYVEDGGRLFVDRQAGEAPTDRDLELWVIVGDAAPVSLGVLTSDEAIDQFIVPANLRDKLAGATLAITDEPIGGSPTGDPTGTVMAAGEISAI